jgi:protein-disulfide isomerase
VLLIFLQVVVLGHLCPGCLIVDGTAVLLALVELCWGRSGLLPAPGRRGRLLWLAAALLAVGSAAAVGAAGGPREDGQVPPQVSALWVPGKVTIVEVADFECQHCRQLHAVVQDLLRAEGEHVRLVQLTVPVSAHPHSRDAARAFLCAGQQGKGREMAESLFAARTPTPGVCERLAESLGLSLPAYRTCVAAPETNERIDAEAAWVKEASPEGLPVLWVQQRRLPGPQDLDTLRRAVRAAEQELAGRQAASAH